MDTTSTVDYFYAMAGVNENHYKIGFGKTVENKRNENADVKEFLENLKTEKNSGQCIQGGGQTSGGPMG